MFEIKKKISNGKYDYALVPGHPNASKHGYVLYHRVVMENHIGRLLTKQELVHHRNENPKDNDIDNLEIKSHKGHMEEHGLIYEAEMVEVICAFCGEKTVKRAHNVEFKRKNGQDNFYCNQICSGNATGYKRDPNFKITHGTKNSYSYHKCRCLECTGANRLSRAKYRKKNLVGI